jgi:RNA polymerase sigma factor for flagellar operon FliA
MISRGYSGRVRRVSREHRVRTFADAEQLQKAWREYKAGGDRLLRNRLVEHYLFLVKYSAERVGSKLPDEVDVDDLMSAGIFGLVDAIDAFDLERGVKFETYCAPRVRGAILDELRSMDWVPRLVRHRAHKLADAVRALEVELGRLPNEGEIAQRMGLDAAEFEKLMKDANAVSLVSLSQTFSDSESSREVSEEDVLPDEKSIDPVVEAQKSDVRDLMKRDLSRAEQLILVLYYYEQMTMKEIGATLDLSESRVSQMHSAIIDRMRGQLGLTIAFAPLRADVFA